MKKLSFTNKGENLKNLSPIIKEAKILPLVIINDINDDVINDIKNLGDKVIIRSSASNEDTNLTSNAGAFLSIANIDTSNKEIIKDAFDKVKIYHRNAQ